MAKEKGKTGFGFGENRENQSTEEIDDYIGKFVCINQNGNSVLGILHKIDKINNHAYLKPSLVGYADSSIYIEHKTATRINLPLTIIRPIKGTLEEYVEEYNSKLRKPEKDSK